MTRDEAVVAMKYGCKVTHRHFSDDEFIYMKDHDIYSEEGYKFGSVFAEFWWEKSHNENFADDWSVYFIPKDTYETTGVFSVDSDCYHHFGIHPKSACLYGDDPKDIETLKFKIHEDQSIPETHTSGGDYWGWIDYAKDDEFTAMIFPQRFLLNMCFPAGIKGTENANQGKAYRLEFIKEN